MPRSTCVCCNGRDSRRSPHAIPLSVNAQKYLRLLQREGLAAVARVNPSEAERGEIQHALESYARYVADRDLRSLKALHGLTSSP